MVHNLKYRNRNLGGSWGSSEITLEVNGNAFEPLDMAVTADDQVHIFYTGLNSPHGVYNVWNNGWGTAYGLTSNDDVRSQRIAANSNDLYVIWNNESTIKLRQRDFTPLAPQGLAVTASGNNHPLLSWDANNEADLDEYKIYKKLGNGNWNFLASTSSTSYEDTEEDVVGKYPQANETTAYYKITAVDLSANESGYSNTVSIRVEGDPLSKRGVNDGSGANVPEQFALYQNYPNPFNPSTAIQFDLPEAAEVELAIYSLSGQRIATLINGDLEAGSYEAKWNGKDAFGNAVSSGIYLYQLKAGEKLFIKKMMLIK